MRMKLLFPLTVSFIAAFAAQVEGTMVTLWAADRSTACSGSSPSESCSMNAVVGFLAGTFFAVETLAATLTSLVLYRNGRRLGAAATAASLVAALAVEHIWLMT
jgi:hypothetical protein